eukprot:302264_1
MQSATFIVTLQPRNPDTCKPHLSSCGLKKIANVTNDKAFTQLLAKVKPDVLMKEQVSNISKYTFYAYCTADLGPPFGAQPILIMNDEDFNVNWDLIPIADNNANVFIRGCKLIYFYWKNKRKRICKQNAEIVEIAEQKSNNNNNNQNIPLQRNVRRRINNAEANNVEVNNADANNADANNVQENNANVDEDERKSKLILVRNVQTDSELNMNEKVGKIRLILGPRDFHKALTMRYLADNAYGDEYSIDMTMFWCVFCNRALSLNRIWGDYIPQRHYKDCHGENGNILRQRMIDLKDNKTLDELDALPDFESVIVCQDGKEDNDIDGHLDWTDAVLPHNAGIIHLNKEQAWSYKLFDKASLNSRPYWKILHSQTQDACKAYYRRIYGPYENVPVVQPDNMNNNNPEIDNPALDNNNNDNHNSDLVDNNNDINHGEHDMDDVSENSNPIINRNNYSNIIQHDDFCESNDEDNNHNNSNNMQ